MYLRHCCQTVDAIAFLDGLDETCLLEYDGSTLFKSIQILVFIVLA